MIKISVFFLTLSILGLPSVSIASPTTQHDILISPYPEPTQELMIPVKGGKVYVRINGKEDGKSIPAVFINGGPGSRHNGFVRLLGLADERPIILYDQLDTGKSEHPNNPVNWKVKRFVEELETIRVELNIERWHVVGHSWGSAIALEYAVRYPQHIASTVLAGTYISTPHWLKDANLLINNAPDTVKHMLTMCESETPPTPEECGQAFTKLYSKYYQKTPSSKEVKAYAIKTGGKSFNPIIYNAMWGPSEFSSTGTLLTYDAVHLLKKIDGKKTMFLVGQYDSARIDTIQDYVTLTPGAELGVVPGGSHNFLGDRPITTEAIFRGWFKRKDLP